MTVTAGVAILGLACIYPDAEGPAALWENILARRTAFRRIPPQRLPQGEYVSAQPGALDASYCGRAALIEGYEFDRLKFRVSGETYRSADPVHWLALDVASRALADAKFPDGAGLSKDTTGVIIGNTLTGEVSRGHGLRLRWPYVRRVFEEQLAAMDIADRARVLESLEARFKRPFAPTGDETLAGGLSNTVAGRVCNQFGFGGGGYTIDGACSSSLLAVAQACRALQAHELDVALVGGVDISLDPFELVGFSRLGALARDEMRIYDEHPTGFLPGEGCGFVVLARADDAISKEPYAVIKGWGISSDGGGGITRPDIQGQQRALERAYQLAGFGIETVPLFEGHGTGTAVGDEVELSAIIRERGRSRAKPTRAAIGSIKGNIGHTKAAAGIAGLLKATLALRHQVRPAVTGNERPHPLLRDLSCGLELLQSAELWPEREPLRAGVSSFGFGGINVHIALEGRPSAARKSLGAKERQLILSSQDAELFLIAADSTGALRALVERLERIAGRLSNAELTDLACELARTTGPARSAIVASTAEELRARLSTLRGWLESGETERMDREARIFLGKTGRAPRIAYLFPGQASAVRFDGGALQRRFASIAEIYEQAESCWVNRPAQAATDIAQPAIIAAELAGLRALEICGVRADCATGHSLGEIAALCWAGAFDERAAIVLARFRGHVMASRASGEGAMAAIGAAPHVVESLIGESAAVCIAGLNAPTQTVISGEHAAVHRILLAARAKGLPAASLPVSHAFHSPQMSAAAGALAEFLQTFSISAVKRTVFSSITGAKLPAHADMAELLTQQLTAPVRFQSAFEALSEQADLMIEVGPGRVLTDLVADRFPILALDASGPSLCGLLGVLGAVFAKGGRIDTDELFAQRFSRPFSLERAPRFFTNPCALPEGEIEATRHPEPQAGRVEPTVLPAAQAGRTLDEPAPLPSPIGGPSSSGSALNVLREVIAARMEMPFDLILPETLLATDLHLNSITAAQVIADTARRLGLSAPVAPTDFAHASVAQIAETLEALAGTRAHREVASLQPPGLDTWVRPFEVIWTQIELSARQHARGSGSVWRVFSPGNAALGEQLQSALTQQDKSGVAVCLPENARAADIAPVLLAAARLCLDENERERCLLLVQPGGAAAAFFRSVHLENRGLTTCIVDTDEKPVERALAELSVASGYHEVRYGARGRRFLPTLRALPLQRAPNSEPLTAADVLLVSGGGKGIAAECALALAKRSGARLVVLGRADPEQDAALRENLERFRAKGVQFDYARADVSDASAVRAAVERFGPITAILHGAGVNQPKLASLLDERTLRETWVTKVTGLENLLAAVDAASLRLLVSFGSIIARTGLRGESHYGLANDNMARLAAAYGQANPQCRCLTLEWSIWSDIGMGERLGSIEALAREGIAAISPEQGIAMLWEALESAHNGSLVISGRIADLPTLRMERPPLPLLRFIETPRVYFPGIELIADATLSSATDPYLEDHVFSGERLFPAVLGLEAMAQCVRALTGISRLPKFERVELSRPIVIPASGAQTLRVMALARGSGIIDVAIRSADSDFAIDHFRATCHVTGQVEPDHAVTIHTDLTGTAIDSMDQLYGPLLFHSGRFRGVSAFHHLEARSCCFEVARSSAAAWFGAFLPQTLLLGDPGLRDAAIHGIQACVPHQRLLPIGVGKIVSGIIGSAKTLIVTAAERYQQGVVYEYDLDIRAPDGSLLEAWRGLRLQAVEALCPARWQLPWFNIYLERCLPDLLPGSDARLVLKRGAHGRSPSSADLLGDDVVLVRRGDGKPEFADDSHHISVTHGADLTGVVTAKSTVACDLESVQTRSERQWEDLLGVGYHGIESALASLAKDSPANAATRIWTARECLKKAGAPFDAPLSLEARESDGWVVFKAGDRKIASRIVSFEHGERPLALAILAGVDHESV